MLDDNNEELCLLKYLVNETGPKNTVENIKLLKIHHLSGNPKNTATMTNIQKNTNFRNSKPKKILRSSLSVNKCAKSTPWVQHIRSGFAMQFDEVAADKVLLRLGKEYTPFLSQFWDKSTF